MIANAERRLRVLIVDNEEEKLELYFSVFVSKGYSVRKAITCADALALVPIFRPDAVFTSLFDVGRSDPDLCLSLRKMPETVEALIVAITNYGIPINDNRATAGFDYFLVRPISLSKVLETMQHLVGYKGNSVKAVRVPIYD